MVQVTLRVGCRQNGSMNAVAGSGMASMWDASIDFHPRMEEPSKPKPSSNTSSVNSPIGTLKCCQVPKVSTNFTSTIFAPCFRAFSMTLFGVAVLGVLAVLMNGLAAIGSVQFSSVQCCNQQEASVQCSQSTKIPDPSSRPRNKLTLRTTEI